MASNLKITLAAANTQATPFSVLANGGFLDIYSNAQPSTPETAAGATALATLVLPSPFGSAISNGVITVGTIATVTIANTGTAVWFRVTASDHVTAIFDGAIGTSASDLNLNAVALVAGASLQITSGSFTVPGF